jgi:hypothetical protein
MTHNIIEFIHIPKCGGTFIKNLIRKTTNENDDSELACKDYRQKHGGDCTNLHVPYFTLFQNENKKNKIFFAIIRCPVSRLISNYYYDVEIFKQIFGQNACSSLNAFVDYLHKNPSEIYKHIHLYPQSYYLTDKKNSTTLSQNIIYLSFTQLPLNIYYLLKSMNVPLRNENLFKHFNKQELDTCNVKLDKNTLKKIYDLYLIDYLLLKNYL